MKIRNILVLFVFFGCNTPRHRVNTPFESNINDLLVSDLKRVPDSLKQWVYVFKDILLSDQQYRKSSSLYLNNLSAQNAIDRANEQKILEFLSKYGYPDIRVGGTLSSIAIPSVMNHATIPAKKLFYPFLIAAYKDGKIKSDLATFEDKFNVEMNRRQYYGTQLKLNSKNEYMLAPVYNADSLDYFRKEIGLETINEYLKESFKLEWDINNYKDTEDSLKKELKINDSIPIRFMPLKPI